MHGPTHYPTMVYYGTDGHWCACQNDYFDIVKTKFGRLPLGYDVPPPAPVPVARTEPTPIVFEVSTPVDAMPEASPEASPEGDTDQATRQVDQVPVKPKVRKNAK